MYRLYIILPGLPLFIGTMCQATGYLPTWLCPLLFFYFALQQGHYLEEYGQKATGSLQEEGAFSPFFWLPAFVFHGVIVVSLTCIFKSFGGFSYVLLLKTGPLLYNNYSL
jgi:hypothetical protein